MNSTEQSSSLNAANGFEHWTDPATGQEFVLVPAEQFEKIRAVIEGIARRANWDDPAFDVYEQLRKKK